MRNKKLIVLFSVLCAITLLIVLNSVVFSVQHVEAHCENLENEGTPATRQAVLDNHGIRKGGSIFMVSKKKVTDRIEEKVANVEVLGVEKVFPNRIFINYKEIGEAALVLSGGKKLACSDHGKILRVVGEDQSVPALVTLELGEEAASLTPGAYVLPRDGGRLKTVVSVFESLARIGYGPAPYELISRLDLTGYRESAEERVLLLTTTTGMEWKILGGEYMFEKLRLALSVFNELPLDQRRTGKLILSGGNNPRCQLVGSDGEITDLPQNS